MITLVSPDGMVQYSTLQNILATKKYTVIYFYPKDDTSGCTLEAKTFSEHKDKFNSLDCNIIGVSRDNDISHTKFCNKYDLSISLVSDTELDMHQDERFQVWKEKSMYGKKYMGTERSTFILDSNGKVLHEWRKVSVPGHVEEVLAFVQDLH